MAVVSIEYNDGNKKDLGYKSVNISYNGSKIKKSFNSGNFVKDWYDCTKLCITKIHGKEFVSHSSSVNNFFMDGAKYDSAYLLTDKGNAVLSYDSKHHDKGIELFVEDGTTPTWEQLRKICGDEKVKEETKVKSKSKKKTKKQLTK
jgi:hypothetical protein